MERYRDRAMSRERVHAELDSALDYADRPGYWGEVGVNVLVQDGKRATVRKRIEETKKEQQ